MRPAVLILVCFPVAARAQGPIETRNHQATSLAFLRLTPRGEILSPGQRSFSLGLSVSNSLRFEGPIREDQETQRLSLRYGWGVRRGEWTVEVPFLFRNGGFTDPLIEGYHSLIGIYNFRGTVPFGRVEENLGPSGSYGSGSGLGDVVGTYSRPLGPQALWSVALKLPTGNANELMGSGSVDLGASLYSRWKLGPRWNLYGQIGVVLQGAPYRLKRARRLIDQESISIQYRANSRDYWTAQWQSEPSAIETGDQFLDGPHRQLSLGYTRRLSDRESFQVYFNEDGDFLNYRMPQLANIAPDFTFGLSWTRRF